MRAVIFANFRIFYNGAIILNVFCSYLQSSFRTASYRSSKLAVSSWKFVTLLASIGRGPICIHCYLLPQYTLKSATVSHIITSLEFCHFVWPTVTKTRAKYEERLQIIAMQHLLGHFKGLCLYKELLVHR